MHWKAELDLGTSVEHPFNCPIILNRQVKQSIGRSMGWTFENNMVDGLFYAALASRRAVHIPFV